MKVKTSITLSPTTLVELDHVARDAASRSHVIETAILEFLARRKRDERDARDLELLDRHADALNAEMDDVLAFQADA